MSQTDVQCFPNQYEINATVKHVNGKTVDLTIAPNNAHVDANGVIRAFTIDLGGGDVCGYVLHPFYSKTEKGILWAVDFLASYGLARAGGRLIKTNKNMGRAQQETVHMARFITFSNPGGQVVRSFVAHHFLPEHLGYHDLLNDELVIIGQMKLKK